MTGSRSGQRTDFQMRCRCGETYTSSDSHVGKKISCRCGHVLTITRPTEARSERDERRERDELKGESAGGPLFSKADVRRSSSRSRSSGAGTGGSASRSTERSGSTERGRESWFVPAVRDRVAGWRHDFGNAALSWVDSEWRALTSTHGLQRWGARLAWGWCLCCAAIWLLLVTTSESFLPATLLAYGPRVVVLLPFVVVAPLALLASRRTLVPLSLALLVVLGPIMGGRISWRSIGRGIPPQPAANTMRVMSFNTEGGVVVARRIRELVASVKPDIMTFQECGDVLGDSLLALGMHVSREANLCTASQWTLEPVEVMPRGNFGRIAEFGFGGTGLAMRQFVQSPHGRFAIVNLHLETARKGLEGLASDEGFIPDKPLRQVAKELAPEGSPMRRVNLNAAIRDRESERAAIWSQHGDRRIPVVVSGDFNIPVESAIFRRHWGSFTDAFDASGTGFGWSKREGKLLRIRIDHVLMDNEGPRPVGTWLGPDLGSDHLPVIADLRWP